MKDISKLTPIYLEKYDIEVNPYLTYSQIQQIVNAVIGSDSWAERNQIIDLLILKHATNINVQEIEHYGHDLLLTSGLIDAVCGEVVNLSEVYKAIEYTESTARALAQILKELPNLIEPLNLVMKRGAKSSEK